MASRYCSGVNVSLGGSRLSTGASSPLAANGDALRETTGGLSPIEKTGVSGVLHSSGSNERTSVGIETGTDGETSGGIEPCTDTGVETTGVSAPALISRSLSQGK